MTLNLTAIFGAETADTAISTMIVAMPTEPTAGPVEPDNQLVQVWPVIPGAEHFNLYVDPDARHWPEFIPGHHYDVRQPSRLRGMFAPRQDEDENK